MFRRLGWPIVVPGLAAAVVCAGFAMRMQPPAVTVAARSATAAASLLMAKLLVWVVRSGDRFQREERLVTFVIFAAIVLSWIGVQERISEAAFDYQVTVQTRALIASARNLSRELQGFVDERQREAPPPPKPASWEADTLVRERFDTETVVDYEQRFGAQVRTAHDLLTFRNMRDRDLEAFYRRPANTFQMLVISEKLVFLAEKLERESQAHR